MKSTLKGGRGVTASKLYRVLQINVKNYTKIFVQGEEDLYIDLGLGHSIPNTKALWKKDSYLYQTEYFSFFFPCQPEGIFCIEGQRSKKSENGEKQN